MEILGWVLSLIAALGGTAGIIKLCRMWFNERRRRQKEKAREIADRIKQEQADKRALEKRERDREQAEIQLDREKERHRREQFEYWENLYKKTLQEQESRYKYQLEECERKCEERMSALEAKYNVLETRYRELESEVSQYKLQTLELNLRLVKYENSSGG